MKNATLHKISMEQEIVMPVMRIHRETFCTFACDVEGATTPKNRSAAAVAHTAHTGADTAPSTVRSCGGT